MHSHFAAQQRSAENAFCGIAFDVEFSAQDFYVAVWCIDDETVPVGVFLDIEHCFSLDPHHASVVGERDRVDKA